MITFLHNYLMYINTINKFIVSVPRSAAASIIFGLFYYTHIHTYIYPFLVLEIAGTTILYSHKVLITFNHHLNHKHKFLKVARNTLYVHLDRPYCSKILSPILCTIARKL